MTDRPGPLAGVLVVDLSRVLSGPWCTQMLGDLGAEVIKIERPKLGDDTRRFAPPFVRDAEGNETGESAYFMGANRNKRSITVDLTKEEGRDLVRRLIAKADILVENYKTGDLARYGLAWDDVRALNPRLVYCSITGFGHTGPYAERPGYDFLIQGIGGIMSITGEPGREPQRVGVPIADMMSGMYAAVATLGALHHAKATGEGQHIDIGMLDTQVAWLANQGMGYLATGEVPDSIGNNHPNIVPYQVFPTADGHIIVAIGNDAQFQRFCRFAGLEELIDDPVFATNGARVRNRKTVTERLDAVFAAKPSKFWLDGLDAQGIGVAPINRLDQVFSDPHVLARGMVTEIDHPATKGAKVRLISSPFKLSATPVGVRHVPPMLGQHTEEVLREVLGLDEAEIARLRAAGAV